MSEGVEIKLSSFNEVLQQKIWVDAMVEKNDSSIIRNSAWEVVPRPVGKSVVGSRLV